jgi:hypothetical protein
LAEVQADGERPKVEDRDGADDEQDRAEPSLQLGGFDGHEGSHPDDQCEQLEECPGPKDTDRGEVHERHEE